MRGRPVRPSPQNAASGVGAASGSSTGDGRFRCRQPAHCCFRAVRSARAARVWVPRRRHFLRLAMSPSGGWRSLTAGSRSSGSGLRAIEEPLVQPRQENGADVRRHWLAQGQDPARGVRDGAGRQGRSSPQRLRSTDRFRMVAPSADKAVWRRQPKPRRSAGIPDHDRRMPRQRRNASLRSQQRSIRVRDGEQTAVAIAGEIWRVLRVRHRTGGRARSCRLYALDQGGQLGLDEPHAFPARWRSCARACTDAEDVRMGDKVVGRLLGKSCKVRRVAAYFQGLVDIRSRWPRDRPCRSGVSAQCGRRRWSSLAGALRDASRNSPSSPNEASFGLGGDGGLSGGVAIAEVGSGRDGLCAAREAACACRHLGDAGARIAPSPSGQAMAGERIWLGALKNTTVGAQEADGSGGAGSSSTT